MAQISRPFQIALLAVLALAVVGVLALRLHPTSSSSGSSSAVATAVPAPSAAAPVKSKTSTRAASKTKAVTPHRVHHSAHAVKAGAGAAASTKHVAGKPSISKAATKTASPTKTAVAPTVHKVKPAKSSASALASLSGERRVEAQLAHGDSIALVLFWDPKGTEDISVHHAVQTVAKRPGVGVDEAPASAVASFGTITRGIQIYETPTLLVINKKGQTTVLTGVQDAYTIEQAITEARHS